MRFLVQAIVVMIVDYDRNTFIIQVNVVNLITLLGG
jgi:hypothetical protein